MSEELLSDEEVYRRVRANPGTQARVEELLARVRRGEEGKSPGISAEDLPAFLKEHGL